jgi:thiol-disulfide isomerase/thioredoxin
MRCRDVSANLLGMARLQMTQRTLTLVAFALAGVLALAAGLHFGGFAGDPNATDLRGKDAGAIFGVALPDIAGREQAIGQWKGKVLVVNFWATWCVPCREEMPEFVKAQREFGGQGLQFVGIAIDDAAKVREFAAELGLNYPALIGGYGAIELSRTLGNRLGALPFTIVVDRSGRISHTQLGPIKDAQLRSMIGQLL